MSEQTPLVSVIVPIYNVERYLGECLDSIMKQTLTPIEIICVDDGSTDSSGAILTQLAAQDERIIIIRQENSGYGAAMNKGLAAARGTYIGIVESDDWIEPDMYARLYHTAEAEQLDVCKAAFYISYTEHEVRDDLYNELPEELFEQVIVPSEHRALFWYQPSVWSALYRREFLKENDIWFTPSPGAAYQDTGFSMKVLCAAERFSYIPQAWLHYRSDNPDASVRSRAKVYAVGTEMSEARAYVREKFSDEEQRKRLVLLWSISFGLDVWNLKRIDASFRQEYLMQMRATYQQGEANGEIDTSFFPQVYQTMYALMRRTPPLFLFLVGLLPKSGMRSRARRAKETLKSS